jgi:hypothetical protein
MKRLLAVSVALSLTACGSDSTGPQYESIAGSYQGVMAGITDGITLAATFGVTVTQSSGNLLGSWSLAGTLTDGFSSVPIQGTGNLAGIIQPGQNPSVNLRIKNLCPSYHADFSGVYDSPNQTLTVSGPIDIESIPKLVETEVTPLPQAAE